MKIDLDYNINNMETLKSFTDLQQSKVLAEILPIESADMIWDLTIPDLPTIRAIPYEDSDYSNKYLNIIPCWSLAALIEQLKSEIILENKQILFLHLNKYNDNCYDIRYTNSWTGDVLIAEADNLVDACVAMIEKLHELNLL